MFDLTRTRMTFSMADTTLNVQHLQIVDNGKTLPEEQNFVPASQFESSINPFTDLIPVLLIVNSN